METNDHMVMVRVPQRVWEAFKVLASSKGLSGAAFIRALIFEELKKQPKEAS